PSRSSTGLLRTGTMGAGINATKDGVRPMTDREGMSTAETEVVDLCRELIAIDTSNYGDHSGPGEREAAEYVAAKLDEVGLEATIYESHPKRSSVVARIEGTDPSRPPLLVQG